MQICNHSNNFETTNSFNTAQISKFSEQPNNFKIIEFKLSEFKVEQLAIPVIQNWTKSRRDLRQKRYKSIKVCNF
jgi:hypothetical protein